MNFTPLDGKGAVDGFCIIKSIDKKTSSKGDAYLDLILGDSAGEINAKLWNYSETAHGVYESNMLVKIRGIISIYNGSDQLRIDRIRRVNEGDGVNIEDFVESAGYSGNQMFEELHKIAEDFQNSGLSRLVLCILDENRLSLLYWPAAFRLHHAIRGGLLYHTLSVVRLAQSVCDIYTFVDRELLISGAILHDIAKTLEFNVSDSGLATGYSVKGNLLGHLAEGAMIVRKTSEQLGISPELSMLLEHMILSHHGEPDFGAAVRPMFIEAELLSELDMMDARVYEMREALYKVDGDDFTGRLWAMDNRRLYAHNKTNLNNKTKLF